MVEEMKSFVERFYDDLGILFMATREGGSAESCDSHMVTVNYKNSFLAHNE